MANQGGASVGGIGRFIFGAGVVAACWEGALSLPALASGPTFLVLAPYVLFPFVLGLVLAKDLASRRRRWAAALWIAVSAGITSATGSWLENHPADPDRLAISIGLLILAVLALPFSYGCLLAGRAIRRSSTSARPS